MSEKSCRNRRDKINISNADIQKMSSRVIKGKRTRDKVNRKSYRRREINQQWLGKSFEEKLDDKVMERISVT